MALNDVKFILFQHLLIISYQRPFKRILYSNISYFKNLIVEPKRMKFQLVLGSKKLKNNKI